MKYICTAFAVLITLNSCIDNNTGEFTKPIEKRVKDFYSWYLDDYFNNEKNIELSFVVIDGIQTLDTTTYFNTIRHSGFFSEKYIERRKKEITPCLELVNKLDPEKVEAHDGNPAELISGEACNFLFYYNFLFHQGEGTKDVEVESFIIDPTHKNKVIAMVKQLDEKGGEPNGYELKITLEQENDKWLITEIARNN